MQLVDQKKRSSREELEPILYAALVDSMCQNFWPMFIGSVCTAVAAVLTALKTGNVLLTRQFRMPAFVNGHDGMLIESPGGLLDDATPEERIRAEVEEETGYRVHRVEKIFEAFMSPGSVTEKLYFYVGDYDSSMRVSDGGGVEEEGEEIETIEVPLQTAMQMIERGESLITHDYAMPALSSKPAHRGEQMGLAASAECSPISKEGFLRRFPGNGRKIFLASIR